jgi:hypothetical protein
MLGRRNYLLDRIAEANGLTERPKKFAGSPFRNTHADPVDGFAEIQNRGELENATIECDAFWERRLDDVRARPADLRRFVASGRVQECCTGRTLR